MLEEVRCDSGLGRVDSWNLEKEVHMRYFWQAEGRVQTGRLGCSTKVRENGESLIIKLEKKNCSPLIFFFILSSSIDADGIIDQVRSKVFQVGRPRNKAF